tara:strand:+ start:4462 stop:5835 length:1374 start_codon:yes stop_codon:yes gene_type:complete
VGIQIANKFLNSAEDSSSLAFFRIGFGILMCFSIIRFWLKGWIKSLYIDPQFHFSYYGFEWVKPIGEYTYIIFIICFISSFMVMIGLKYRAAIICFFLSFTYIELMDKTTYLNHYYFISMLSFLMIFLPLNASFSLDNYSKKKTYVTVPSWCSSSIKLFVALVYIYAGIAKLNSDWLFEAMPLKIWLTSKYDIPIIGESLLQLNWVHYLMSWGGMIYDLTIPFLLLYPPSRLFAFIMVIFFHVFTMVLFPIGMFPHIMIFCATIFFSATKHKKILNLLKRFLENLRLFFKNKESKKYDELKIINQNKIAPVLFVFFFLQAVVPFRYAIYPGELFWHEQGYRFSWRVMLIEKVGYTNFRIKDPDTEKSIIVNSSDYLTPFQEKQMSFQPDFILEFAHYLGDKFSDNNKRVKVYAESFVALNGRPSQRFIDPNVNLYEEKESINNKSWIIPLNDEIKGL